MHNTDTTNHAAQIKRLVDGYIESPVMAKMLCEHTDALANQLAEWKEIANLHRGCEEAWRDDYQEAMNKLAEERARVGRLKELIASRRHYDDILDQDGVEPSRRYPALRVVIDRFHAAVAACHEHGDLDAGKGEV